MGVRRVVLHGGPGDGAEVMVDPELAPEVLWACEGKVAFGEAFAKNWGSELFPIARYERAVRFVGRMRSWAYRYTGMVDR